MFQSLNYIDYEDVEALDGYVKTTLEGIVSTPLSIQDSSPSIMSFVETQVELEDSLWQIFSEPK